MLMPISNRQADHEAQYWARRLLLQTMNYELAKELKEAGFPQGGKGVWLLPPDKLIGRRGDRVYAPILEELLEACDEMFISLDQLCKPTGENTYERVWLANSMERGSTPAEAVARLWLVSKKA